MKYYFYTNNLKWAFKVDRAEQAAVVFWPSFLRTGPARNNVANKRMGQLACLKQKSFNDG